MEYNSYSNDEQQEYHQTLSFNENTSFADNMDIPIPSSDDFLPEEFSNEIKTVLTVLYSVLSVGALVGNGCVGIVMIANPSLRTVTNTFIASLVVSDSLIAVWNMPLQLLFYLKNEWTLGEAMCKMTSFVQGVSILTSILTLSAISIERYHVICNPIRARYIRSAKTAFMMILSIWVLAFLLMIPQLWIQRLQQRLAWQHNIYPPVRITYLCVEYFPKHAYNVVYTYGFLVGFYIVPVTIMLFAYGKMTRVLWVRAPIGDGILFPQLSDKRELQKKNIVRMLIAIVILFTTCWLPFFTMHVVMLYCDITYCIRVLQAFALLIGYSNSFMNPFAYFFLNAKYNRVLRKTLSRIRFEKRKKTKAAKRLTTQTTIT